MKMGPHVGGVPPLNVGHAINAKMTDVIEKVAPGVIARKSVDQPMQTGLKSIDSMALAWG